MAIILTGILVMVSPDSTYKVEDKWFSVDKLHHFSYSLSISTILFHVTYCQNGWSYEPARNLAIGVTISLGVLKELYDWKVRHTYISYKDIVADILGVAVAYVLLLTR